jgi:hypothetical protein
VPVPWDEMDPDEVVTVDTRNCASAGRDMSGALDALERAVRRFAATGSLRDLAWASYLLGFIRLKLVAACCPLERFPRLLISHPGWPGRGDDFAASVLLLRSRGLPLTVSRRSFEVFLDALLRRLLSSSQHALDEKETMRLVRAGTTYGALGGDLFILAETDEPGQLHAAMTETIQKRRPLVCNCICQTLLAGLLLEASGLRTSFSRYCEIPEVLHITSMDGHAWVEPPGRPGTLSRGVAPRPLRPERSSRYGNLGHSNQAHAFHGKAVGRERDALSGGLATPRNA